MNLHSDPNAMSRGVFRSDFGLLSSGGLASAYILKLPSGVKAKVTDLGAALLELHCPDGDGSIADVVLGCRDAFQQSISHAYFGSCIGRTAGRVLNAKMRFGGLSLRLSNNSGKHHLHGGSGGFSRSIWRADISDRSNPTVIFRSRFPSGLDGYPGDLDVSLTWELSPPCNLTATISAECTEDTPFNPTIHPYFNLDGHAAGSINRHRLYLPAADYLPIRNDRIAIGTIAPVDHTSFDTRSGATIALVRGENKIGLDHTFVFRENAPDECKLLLTSEESRRVLRVYTDRPCLHLYDGSALAGNLGKGDARYEALSGLAIEPQDFPDAHNHQQFPAFTLRKGEKFESKVSFVFSTSDSTSVIPINR